MPYQIIIPKPVKKQLDAIPTNIRQRILEKIKLLANNPRLEGAVKLKGYINEYRLRIGDYRVRYEIKDKELIILLLRCQHRKDVYRK
jgi:mRNA interferase RelE/StbE